MVSGQHRLGKRGYTEKSGVNRYFHYNWPMENLHIPGAISQKLGFIAKETGLTEEACAHEALLRYIEDFEDARDAERILSNPNRKTYSTEEVHAFIHRKDK